jgi:hypothetical protein
MLEHREFHQDYSVLQTRLAALTPISLGKEIVQWLQLLVQEPLLLPMVVAALPSLPQLELSAPSKPNPPQLNASAQASSLIPAPSKAAVALLLPSNTCQPG